MVQYIRSLLGTYTPQTYTTGEIISGIGGVDFEWIVTACVFLLCMWFTMRIVIGVLFRK